MLLISMLAAARADRAIWSQLDGFYGSQTARQLAHEVLDALLAVEPADV
ncbi:MAG: hypothetical protein ACLFNA_03260 [Halochromatium sp.]